MDNKINRDSSLLWPPLGGDLFREYTDFREVFVRAQLFLPKVGGEERGTFKIFKMFAKAVNVAKRGLPPEL